jgi:valyl-tRNA synthetase
MQPQLAPQIESATRKTYPGGIAAHGTDALRFTFVALAGANRDVRFDLQRVAGYRNFCNKLWNAARFVTLMVPEVVHTGGTIADLSIADRWIRSRFGRRLEEVQTALANYRFDFAATALYEFTWDEFCAWYLELTKPLLQSQDTPETAKRATRATVAGVLEALQRALHPLMPFITEEIWQKTAKLTGKLGATIMLEPYPVAADFPVDAQAEREIAWIQAFVLAVRQIRGEMDIRPSKLIPVLLKEPSAHERANVARHQSYLEKLAGLASIAILEPGSRAPQAATAMVGELTILVPMADLIDAAAETERLEKRLAKTRQDLDKTRAQLKNDNFVEHAPVAVVAGLRERATELERAAVGLEAQLERVRALTGA